MTLAAGIAGMFFILAAFILDEFVPSFNQSTWRYNLLNILGSALLAYYALTIEGWPFLILNLVWLFTAVIKSGELLAHRLRRRT